MNPLIFELPRTPDNKPDGTQRGGLGGRFLDANDAQTDLPTLDASGRN
ncbi:hypothetical protein [Aureliella helgolandensis]|nr:hypothetical protein [Aureliella helgolandensis]